MSNYIYMNKLIITYLSVFSLILGTFLITLGEPVQLQPTVRLVGIPTAHPKPVLAAEVTQAVIDRESEQQAQIAIQAPVTVSSYATLFAYSSTPDQTNGNPNITASGQTVRWGIVANNCLPFGTAITFPEAFGDQVFYVQDRMAARYGCDSFDVWFPSREEALQFGRRTSTVVQ